MQKVFITIAAIAAVTATALLACNTKTADGRTGIAELPQAVSHDSLIHRGSYLVTVMGCNDCHTPKIMGPQGPMLDSAHLLSGHPAGMPVGFSDAATMKSWVLFAFTGTAARGPWGTTFSANISSDATGIGNWTEAQFIKCLREGKYKGMDNSRPLLPPMPWEGIGKASDDDLRAIFAYLKSTKPVENRVPAPLPPALLGKN